MAKAIKWELKMNQARDLKRKGAELLHERVTLLKECFDDPGYLAWCLESKTNEIDFLDAELEDTATDFLTLCAVLEKFPEKESWRKHSLRDMISQCIVDEKKERKERNKPSYKEQLEEALKENERLRTENRILKESLKIACGNRMPEESLA